MPAGALGSLAADIGADGPLRRARERGGEPLATARQQARLFGRIVCQLALLEGCGGCREVALSVAAAVALVATESMVARSTGADTLSCLLGKRPEEKSALKQAEECIAQLRYDPFASEQVTPNPVNPILLRILGAAPAAC